MGASPNVWSCFTLVAWDSQSRHLGKRKRCVDSTYRWFIITQSMIAGHQTLKLLQNIHSSGWLHRDVKPANFVRTRDSDPASGGQWRIVDFGLAKPYISKDGDIIDARDGYNEFRGSTNYASLKAHQREELGGAPLCGSSHVNCCAT